MAAAEIHSYTDEDRATLVRLYTEALRFTSQDGRDALHELWQTALNIGFTGGVKAGKTEEILRTSRVRERELEEERMWGFNVGWKLAIEECALQASKASTLGPSLPSISSVSTALMQTDLPLPCSSPDRSTVSMQTDPPVVMSSPCLISGAPAASLPPSQVALDERSKADVDVWHGAPEPEPEPDSHSPSQLSPSSFIRDFSALRTGVSHPFSSLQRRHRRGPRASLVHIHRHCRRVARALQKR
ncbi:hypothetical protein MSAN_00216000 [Mycena sanguinolenta]|uniref:Uncharacterized protein n=1 Tax=Mycena sanguinolenta TaxID=230812 RepID=A0A8H7DLI7_9AGAR|nr:hypothetical protein MSAN_00216000 [Mycena sanguinolenta]